MIVDGVSTEPDRFEPRDLQTSTGGLQLPTASASTGPLTPAPTPNRWIGLELDTAMADGPVHVHELIVDAQLDNPVACAAPGFNVALWDTTSAVAPALVAGGTLTATTNPRNSRSFIPVNFTLQPAKRYRLVVRATSFRFTNVSGPSPSGALRVTGSLNYRNDNGCAGSAVVFAPLVSTRAYVAVRWAEEPHTQWTDLGHALAGTNGTPQLFGEGELVALQDVTMTLRKAKPHAPVWFFLGVNVANLPFKGGTLVPQPLVAVGGVATDVNGKLTVGATMSTNLPPGTEVVIQAWVVDPVGPKGVAASNGVMGTSP